MKRILAFLLIGFVVYLTNGEKLEFSNDYGYRDCGWGHYIEIGKFGSLGMLREEVRIPKERILYIKKKNIPTKGGE